MRKIKMLVDCDQVLCDFTSLFLRLLNEHTGRKHTLADVTHFKFTDCICNKHEEEYVWRRIDATPGLVRTMKWLPGAPDGLNELRKLGRVVCVTSPHHGPTWVPERFDWLMHKAGFKKADIRFTCDKSDTVGDMLVDDRLENLFDWDHGQRVVFDQPHNRRLAWGDRRMTLMRAHTWAEVVNVAQHVASRA